MKQFTEEEKIQLLSDLIAIKSVNENEIEVATYLKDLFSQYGIESTIVPVTDTRVNLVAEIGNGKPVIGISGHMWYVNTKLNIIFKEYKRFIVLSKLPLIKNTKQSLSLDFEPLQA